MDSLNVTLIVFVTETLVVEFAGEILETVGGVVSAVVPVEVPVAVPVPVELPVLKLCGQKTLSCPKAQRIPCIAINESFPI